MRIPAIVCAVEHKRNGLFGGMNKKKNKKNRTKLCRILFASVSTHNASATVLMMLVELHFFCAALWSGFIRFNFVVVVVGFFLNLALVGQCEFTS